MGKSFVVAVTVSLLLSACAAGRIGESGYSRFLVTEPVPTLPNVFVRGGQSLVVDQEPILLTQDTEVVTWALDASTSWQFVNDVAFVPVAGFGKSVAVDRDVASCAVTGAEGRLLACTFRLKPGQKLSYTLTVRDRTTEKVLRFDPTVGRTF